MCDPAAEAGPIHTGRVIPEGAFTTGTPVARDLRSVELSVMYIASRIPPTLENRAAAVRTLGWPALIGLVVIRELDQDVWHIVALWQEGCYGMVWFDCS